MMKITTGERSMPPLMTTIVANAAAMPTIADGLGDVQQVALAEEELVRELR